VDFAGGGQGDGSGEQVFARANAGGENGFADEPQVDFCRVATDLRVEGRLAMDEGNFEAEFVGVEVAGTLDFRDEELGLDRVENGLGRRWHDRDFSLPTQSRCNCNWMGHGAFVVDANSGLVVLVEGDELDVADQGRANAPRGGGGVE